MADQWEREFVSPSYMGGRRTNLTAVVNCHHECEKTGSCQLGSALDTIGKIQATIKEAHKVSQSLWCDVDDPATNVPGQVGHSFSSKDKGKRHYETSYEEDGETKYESIDTCGMHGIKRGSKSPTSLAISGTVEPDK